MFALRTLPDMSEKIRPIQISIIDFLGVILPGLVWLALVSTGLLMFTSELPVVTPVTMWRQTVQPLTSAKNWMDAISILLAAMIIGFMVKPKAMRVAGFFAVPLAPLHRRLRKLPWKEIKYPYRAVHSDDAFYPILVKLLTDRMGCDVLDLPGNQPFTTAKRLLRVTEPRLWEECEHLEAEVRMIGALYVGAMLSCGLAAAELIREFVSTVIHVDAVAWAVVSAVAFVTLGDGFNHMRLREVEYTYLHALLAHGIQRERATTTTPDLSVPT
jgi:hypothetical protein